MRVIINPSDQLRLVSTPVEEITPRVKYTIEKMLKLMYRSNGIGLAAPQVGWDKRIFVTNHSWVPEDERVFINPEITYSSDNLVEASEGCLSIPGVIGVVHRPDRVRVKAQNLSGDFFEVEADNLFARCIQHEYDHLYGVLFIDKAKRLLSGLGADYE